MALRFLDPSLYSLKAWVPNNSFHRLATWLSVRLVLSLAAIRFHLMLRTLLPPAPSPLLSVSPSTSPSATPGVADVVTLDVVVVLKAELYLFTSWMIRESSSGVKGPLSRRGSNTLCHFSRHCISHLIIVHRY
jgi:hypothetical protein